MLEPSACWARIKSTRSSSKIRQKSVTNRHIPSNPPFHYKNFQSSYQDPETIVACQSTTACGGRWFASGVFQGGQSLIWWSEKCWSFYPFLFVSLCYLFFNVLFVLWLWHSMSLMTPPKPSKATSSQENPIETVILKLVSLNAPFGLWHLAPRPRDPRGNALHCNGTLMLLITQPDDIIFWFLCWSSYIV